MDITLGKTVTELSHAIGVSTTTASLLLGIVVLFVVYKIIDRA